MSSALKQFFGRLHVNEDDLEVETFVRRWPIMKNTD
jgi:hypothetical protein